MLSIPHLGAFVAMAIVDINFKAREATCFLEFGTRRLHKGINICINAGIQKGVDKQPISCQNRSWMDKELQKEAAVQLHLDIPPWVDSLVCRN